MTFKRVKIIFIFKAPVKKSLSQHSLLVDTNMLYIDSRLHET